MSQLEEGGPDRAPATRREVVDANPSIMRTTLRLCRNWDAPPLHCFARKPARQEGGLSWFRCAYVHFRPAPKVTAGAQMPAPEVTARRFCRTFVVRVGPTDELELGGELWKALVTRLCHF